MDNKSYKYTPKYTCPRCGMFLEDSVISETKLYVCQNCGCVFTPGTPHLSNEQEQKG